MIDFLVYEFLCIHVHPTVCILLSPYFIHFLIDVCEILPAIHIAPYNFLYFFPCPSHSLFYFCIFGHILGLAALNVSGWSTLSCLIAVTFLSPRSAQFPITPNFSVLGHQEQLLLICVFCIIFIDLIFHRCPTCS